MVTPENGIVNLTPSSGDLNEIQQLLTECQLPSSDLTASNLNTFLVARRRKPAEDSSILGVVGLEICLPGQDGLLRSLAVKDNYRGQGLAMSLCDRMEVLARQKHGLLSLIHI